LVNLKESLGEALNRPIDSAFLAAFRSAFGVLMFIGAYRYWAKGWIDSILIAPAFHFHYEFFGWVAPLRGVGMYVVFLAMACSALGMAFGSWRRIASGVFFLIFTYVELCEKAAYLNHYYLVSLLALLLAFMPEGTARVPRFVLLALRLQIGLVYFFAGVAKISTDWLIHAQPLKIWLRANSDFPLFGSLLEAPGVAHAAAWLSMLLDLTAPLWLSLRSTRRFAYLAILGFHSATACFFPIGIFPWLMVLAATVFFEPGWPRRVPGLARFFSQPIDPQPRAGLCPVGAFALAAYFCLQLLLPLRHLRYPGSANWTDEGFRFAWRVMLIDKVGSVHFRLKLPGSGQRVSVEPKAFLTPFQERMMAQSPDMIVELAQHVAADYQRRFGQFPAVYADAWAAMNGRPSERLLDPNVDLTTLDPAGFTPFPILSAH